MKQPELNISLLGGLTILLNGTAVTGFASRKVEALFVYLVCNPQPQPREVVATLLWSNNDQYSALANLSVALSSLRKQLAPYIVTTRHTIGFNTQADFTLDTAVFEHAITQAKEAQKRRGKLSRSSAVQLATAVALYNGDFLVGFNVRKAAEFEAWVLLQQERLRQMLLKALADLITFHQQRGQVDAAIRYAQQLLAVDPLQEGIHQQLMTLFVQNNQRAAALAQYEQCVRVLEAELGVEPDAEISALYASIVAEQTDKQTEHTFFVVPRPSAAPLHNLPAPTTSFIGRQAELSHIEAWLATSNGRLLTIFGPGGSGKSRLAQEAARSYRGEFADGVWFVSLVPLSDMDGVVTAVATAIGLNFSGKETPDAQLLKHLISREMLLVLDNIEHLLTPALLNFITQLTEQAPDLRLLITSRERLRLAAEGLLDLYGLPFPTANDQNALHTEMIAYPAVQLFVTRVQHIKADFKLDKQETAVMRLCQLVGGLPLALELAATWTRVLSVSEIVAEIQRGLDALTSTLRDVPARHRSLRAVIESSWQLLSLAEQTLFAHLSVFRGGFTRTAAQAVANATLIQLMSLVDRSFLRRDTDQRFRRHPLLLQFAQEQLAAQPTEQACKQADHARFFADFVQACEVELPGEGAPQALDAIGAELENIRAAWQWGLAQLDVSVLDKLVVGIGRFFADRSRILEGAELFENSLKLLRSQPITAVHEQLAAKMQVELGHFWHENGRFADARTILEEAHVLTLQHNLTQTRIACLRQLGVVTVDQGQHDDARCYSEEALQLCRTEGDTDQILPILNDLGNLCVRDGDYEQARVYFDEAMTLAQLLGSTLRIAILHNNIGIIANRQKNYPEAIRRWQLARDSFQQLGHHVGLANATHNIAMAYFNLEQYEQALENIQASNALHVKVGHRRGQAGGQAVMGNIYRKQGKRLQARRHYMASLRLAKDVGVAFVAVGVLVEMAELEMTYGKMALAALLLAFAVEQPAIEGAALENSQRLLEELSVELPAQLMAAAQTAAQAHTLDSLITDLLNGRL